MLQKLLLSTIVCLAVASCSSPSSTGNNNGDIDIRVGSSDNQFFDGAKNSGTSNTGYQSNQVYTTSSCPGAPTQRVVVGDRAYVSTKSDRLIVRSSGYKSASEITRIYPGTYFTIIGGPVCSDNWSYWKIQTDSGTVGWVSEGGDSIDYYFFAPAR